MKKFINEIQCYKEFCRLFNLKEDRFSSLKLFNSSVIVTENGWLFIA